MTKNNTKRSLILSALSLLLCFSMLIGTTFAWFTDEVSSKNNIIKAGNLDVDLKYWNGTDWASVDTGTPLFSEETFWEPGHTEVVYLKVENLGSLSFKYQFGINILNESKGINAAGETFWLSDYIKMGVVELDSTSFAPYETREDALVAAETVSTLISAGYSKSNVLYPAGKAPAGEASEICVALVVYMPTNIDNVANYMTGTNPPSINLGLNVFATQLSYEEDSFGTDYDKDAAWVGMVNTDWYNTTDKEFTLVTAEELAGLAEIVNSAQDTFAGKTIKLGADIDLGNVNWTPIGTKSAEGEKAFTRTFAGTFDGQGHTISNLRVVGGNALGLFGRVGTGAHFEDLIIDGAYVSGTDYVGALAGYAYLAANCIKNCTVLNAVVIATPYQLANGEYDGGAKAGAIVGYALNGSIIGNTVKDSTVIAYRDLGGIAGMLNADGIGDRTLVAEGNTVDNVTISFVGVPGKYAEGKANGNMNEVVGRVGSKSSVGENTVKDVKKDENQKGVTVISTLDELIAFAKAVNGGETFAGKTVILGADIDLLNMEWTPIGTASGFYGTFDGQNHTISNLKITGNKSTVGLFANTYNGEIRNLTVENAQVSGDLNVGVVAGNPYTSKYTNITVKGHVEVNGSSYVGGVGGKNAYADWTNITVDVDETSYVKAISTENGLAYRTYVGGVVGFNGEGGHTFANITSNIDVIGDVCDIGGVFGIAHYNNNFENITCTGNVTNLISAENDGDDAVIDVLETGLIAGVWHNQTGTTVTFTNISATGTISTPNVTPAEPFHYNGLIGKKYSASGEGKLVITNYVEEDGIEYALDGVNGDKTLYLVPADYEGTTVTIPEGVDAIGGYAFAYNSNIETIVLPSTVKTLNDRAFRDTSASTVVLNEGLENISYQAFRNALNVKSVVIPSTVTTISKEAFQHSGITELVIPANVTTIEYGGLRDMKMLEKVTIEGDVEIPVYAFRACTNLKEVILKGTNVTFGGRGMIFTNEENGDGSAITVTVANEVIKARLIAADTAAKDYGGYTIICEQTAVEGGYYVEENKAFAYDSKALDNALNDNIGTVVLSGNLKFNASETNANSGYGATGVSVKGGVLDGNGNSLGINNWGTWDAAVHTTGGTIKNITINSGMRGIFMGSATADVYIDNVVLDGTVYTFNSDGGNKNYGVYISNSTLNGWTSHSDVHKEVVYTNCNFGEGQGYAFCRPYGPTSFVGCDFSEGFVVDPIGAVTFENCTINGVALTAENLATLVTNTGNATVLG